MSHEHLSHHGLRLLGIIFFTVSGLCLVDPTLLLGGMDIALPTPSALAEARAGYGGAFAGLGALFWAGAQRPELRRLALGVAALVLGIFTTARVLSMALDGTPNTLAFVNHAVETVGFVMAWLLWRRARSTAD